MDRAPVAGVILIVRYSIEVGLKPGCGEDYLRVLYCSDLPREVIAPLYLPVHLCAGGTVKVSRHSLLYLPRSYPPGGVEHHDLAVIARSPKSRDLPVLVVDQGIEVPIKEFGGLTVGGRTPGCPARHRRASLGVLIVSPVAVGLPIPVGWWVGKLAIAASAESYRIEIGAEL